MLAEMDPLKGETCHDFVHTDFQYESRFGCPCLYTLKLDITQIHNPSYFRKNLIGHELSMCQTLTLKINIGFLCYGQILQTY